MMATTGRGICALKFVGQQSMAQLRQQLSAHWPNAHIHHHEGDIQSLAHRIFGVTPPTQSTPLHLFIKGTNFQIKVWEALMTIPYGTVVAYQDIATAVGSPGATRAVGTAIGSNPIPFIIPCHRVIRKMGEFGNYGSGPARKKALIGWESAKKELHGF
jgi:AraC family transcriptional regulator of adaptative response/methylated-DNA-[protein]-cysteine methyltransferase